MKKKGARAVTTPRTFSYFSIHEPFEWSLDKAAQTEIKNILSRYTANPDTYISDIDRSAYEYKWMRKRFPKNVTRNRMLAELRFLRQATRVSNRTEEALMCAYYIYTAKHPNNVVMGRDGEGFWEPAGLLKLLDRYSEMVEGWIHEKKAESPKGGKPIERSKRTLVRELAATFRNCTGKRPRGHGEFFSIVAAVFRSLGLGGTPRKIIETVLTSDRDSDLSLIS